MRNLARHWPARKPVTLIGVALLALLSFEVASAQAGVPRPITDEAESIRDLYLLVLGMAVIVFIAVEAALVFALIRFRKKDDDLPPQIHGNNLLEVIWTAIPVMIVLVLFVFSFLVLIDVEGAADDDDLTVDVVGFQFSWAFTYDLADLGRKQSNQQGEITIRGTAAQEPVLVIPVNEPVEFKLSSPDVIHSFYVRDFLYKLDIIPGRDNRFTVTARETGIYDAQCAELCGVNHALMRFKLHVMERDEFDRWIAEQASKATVRQP
jgi:cytochrome c oxidase subunit II